ncbi:hypothetical protein [Streptomyces sp. NBC_00120]|uniref:hypothetical protein n=1 Tax=Streptomyces sp. NBC_00120 TaxID=2975660 RepID=UPI00224DBBB8|nr:hypothetical protein [Streptomyces sp. NBC_00120]MCX5320501.1 hypothetical protein [Streptomyces sp. NBC_00120]
MRNQQGPTIRRHRVVFAVARGQLWLAFAVMGLLGPGVGTFSAAMPAEILAVTPKEATSSAMSFNQVVRSVGFCLGSALGGLVTAAHTGTTTAFPAESGYTTAAWTGAASTAVTVAIGLLLRRAGREACGDVPDEQ